MIKTYDLLTPEEAAIFAETVKKLSGLWMPREVGWTLGAATYQDEPGKYPVLARLHNPILRGHFSQLYLKVAQKLEEIMGRKVAVYEGTMALPGFHIFDMAANGVNGNIHVDEPFTRCEMPMAYSNPFSFTVPLCLPAVGAGLHYWPSLTDEDMGHYEVDGTVPEPDFFNYELGKIHLHDGTTPHRIANFGDMAAGEARITLQGHGVKLEDGTTLIYF
jgi:hypothetical protein